MIKQIERVPLNPFVENHPIHAIAMPRKQAITQSNDLSTPLDKLLDTHYLYDNQEKVTVYRYSNKSMNELLFGYLTPRSRDLYLYIMYHIKKNEDYITLRAKDVKPNIGMSERTLTSAIKELREANVINFKAKSVYWVNPHYIFNGNRIEYYRNMDSKNVMVNAIIPKR